MTALLNEPSHLIVVANGKTGHCIW